MERRVPPHALGGEPEVDERAGAAIGRARVGIEQEMRRGVAGRARDVRLVAQPQGLDEGPARLGEARAVFRILIAVELDEVDGRVRRDAQGVRERGIHEHGDARDEGRQGRDPRRLALELDEALRAGVEIEAERVRPERDGGECVAAIGEAADLDARHFPSPSPTTRPCTCFIPPGWVMTW